MPRYRLVSQIGMGGMSVVWRAVDEVLDREVAVKVLAHGADPAVRQQLRSEARAVARLAHPYIAQVFDYGEFVHESGEVAPYVVMELVPGESLADRLANSTKPPWREAVRTGAQVAAALAYAHAHGIVHRDVTPANVIVTSGGAKVVDFGIAAAVGERELDAAGMVLGTPAYLAPERLEGGTVSPAGDVYALGLLVYRCLRGSLPWSASTATAMVRAHRYHEPEPLPDLPGVPAEVIDICHACIARDPAQRPSAIEVAYALAETVGLALPLPDAVAAPVRRAAPGPPESLTVAHPGAQPIPARPTPARPTPARSIPAGSIPAGSIPAGSAPVRSAPARVVAPAVPVAARPGARVASTRRRVLAVIGVAALLAGLAIIIGAAAAADPTPTGSDEVLGVGVLQRSCQVQYRVDAQTSDRFAVSLVAANTGSTALDGGQLGFQFPADQRIVSSSRGAWSQDGASVTVDLGASLAGGRSASFAFVADAPSTNPLPTQFELDGVACAARVLAATPTPAAATPDTPASSAPGKAKPAKPGPGRPGGKKKNAG